MKLKEVDGGITAVQGVRAGGIHCGIKKDGSSDLAMIAFDRPCKTAAVFTRNKVRAGFISVNLKHLGDRLAQAVVINSGCANAGTGKRGIADAEKVSLICAEALEIDAGNVLTASTGRIGGYLPMDKIEQGIKELAPRISTETGDEAAEAIMTTDTVPKKVAVEFEYDGKTIRVGGIAKGAGMIQPDMATMLCFIATDAVISSEFLNKALKAAVGRSFNKITVDGDQSTNDSVILFANEKAGNSEITFNQGQSEFQEALDYICLKLAKKIVRDGEGATTFVEIQVTGADSAENALTAARAMANSMLFKCAVYGKDPNWGRLMAALGSSGVYVNPERIDIFFGDLQIVKDGQQIQYNRDKLNAIMQESELYITLNLNIGDFKDRVWTCDLTHKYVDINMV